MSDAATKATLGLATDPPDDPWGKRIDRGLAVAERIWPKGPSDAARSTETGPRRDAIVAALIVSVLCWGAHEVLGGRAATERDERINERIKALEDVQTDIRIELAGISRAVGADTTTKKTP